jgi:hypothetical protein
MSFTAPNARVAVKPDTLLEPNRAFAPAPLRQPVFLNSVPKSGSHLLRNIVRMFVPPEQQYHAQFIQWANLAQHRAALDPARPMLSWGHLFFSDASAIETAPARRILLVRDPRDWVIARARFFLSEEFQGNVDHLKSGKLDADALINLMIFGIYQKAPPLLDVYLNNAVAWLGTGIHLVRYEELLAHLKTLDSPETAAYFAALLDACGIDMPDDWAARVATGSDRRHSATARENLTGTTLDLPRHLTPLQQQLIEVAAPGVRAILGYS